MGVTAIAPSAWFPNILDADTDNSCGEITIWVSQNDNQQFTCLPVVVIAESVVQLMRTDGFAANLLALVTVKRAQTTRMTVAGVVVGTR